MGVVKRDARSLDHGSYGVFQKGRLFVCILFLVPVLYDQHIDI